MKETLLITGGAGYVGSAISYLFASNGYDVIVVDDSLHQRNGIQSNARFYQTDASNPDLLRTLFSLYEIHAVIHCQELSNEPTACLHPDELYKANVAKTIELLEVMGTHDVHNLIFSSSAAVYGNQTTPSISELSAYKTKTMYGKSKRMAEQIIHDCAQAYDIAYVILRHFSVARSAFD